MMKILNVLKQMSGILVLITILFIILSSALFLRYREAMMRNETLKNEIVNLTKLKKQLSRELEEIKIIKGDLETKISEYTAQVTTLNDNYEREKSANASIRAELDSKNAELARKDGDLNNLQKDNTDLKARLEQDTAEYEKLKEKVNRLVEVKNVLEEKVKQIMNKQGVELEKIVVKAEGVLEGNVLVVNRDFGFIVTDMGRADDIIPGDIVTVYREGSFIGEAQIEKVYETMAAATITREEKPGSIKVGDNVVVKGK